MRGITLNLDGARLSDLYFNFEHPNRTKLYDVNRGDEIDPVDAEEADKLDAKEFVEILGIPEQDREAFVAELVKDFQHRI